MPARRQAGHYLSPDKTCRQANNWHVCTVGHDRLVNTQQFRHIQAIPCSTSVMRGNSMTREMQVDLICVMCQQKAVNRCTLGVEWCTDKKVAKMGKLVQEPALSVFMVLHTCLDQQQQAGQGHTRHWWVHSVDIASCRDMTCRQQCADR